MYKYVYIMAFNTSYSAHGNQTVPNIAALIPKEKFLSRSFDKIQWAD